MSFRFNMVDPPPRDDAEWARLQRPRGGQPLRPHRDYDSCFGQSPACSSFYHTDNNIDNNSTLDYDIPTPHSWPRAAASTISVPPPAPSPPPPISCAQARHRLLLLHLLIITIDRQQATMPQSRVSLPLSPSHLCTSQHLWGATRGPAGTSRASAGSREKRRPLERS